MLQMDFFESQFIEKIKSLAENQAHNSWADDPAHDLTHLSRVVFSAKTLAHQEQAQLEVVVPAAWLHDLVNLPKNDPRRSQASTLSAQAAVEYLSSIHYPERYFSEIHHAIAAHSFSARIECRSIEARVVQDADRLDAIGAIGIARCFAVGGALRRPFYDAFDPFAEAREWDDQRFTLDHFYVKLLKLESTFQTASGKKEAAARVQVMKEFLSQFHSEILAPSRL